MYTKESVEHLKDHVDIVELIGSYVQLKGAGTAHKGLCPFHQEKSPSFIVQRASSHYHCFGCGAHGDAIAFIMNYLSVGFVEAVEVLAERYQIALEKNHSEQRESGPSKEQLKEALAAARDFYNAYLLHTDEGHAALAYLYDRGIDLDFIRTFHVGYAPKEHAPYYQAMKKLGISPEMQQALGLVKNARPQFAARVLFPITDALGKTVGFSGRKIEESAYGPKYINTAETTLFKKSKTLYGLDHSRKRIAKEKKALIVEGQIDALRLIQEGFTFAVAGQGTAFTEEMRDVLIGLGVEVVYLGMDGDEAGRQAAVKIGDLFQKTGVEAVVLPMENDEDPDGVLREQGPEGMQEKMARGMPYLDFIVERSTQGVDMRLPSAKNNVVRKIAAQIREWDHPLMVHESLRKLAALTHVPEEFVGVEEVSKKTPYLIRKSASVQGLSVDPDRIVEADLLRWLFFSGEKQGEVMAFVYENVSEEHIKTAVCKRLFTMLHGRYERGEAIDILTVGCAIDDPEMQLFLSEIVRKKVNTQKAVEGVRETVKKVLERYFYEQREEVRMRIQSGRCSENEVLELAKEFDHLTRLFHQYMREGAGVSDAQEEE